MSADDPKPQGANHVHQKDLDARWRPAHRMSLGLIVSGWVAVAGGTALFFTSLPQPVAGVVLGAGILQLVLGSVAVLLDKGMRTLDWEAPARGLLGGRLRVRGEPRIAEHYFPPPPPEPPDTGEGQ